MTQATPTKTFRLPVLRLLVIAALGACAKPAPPQGTAPTPDTPPVATPAPEPAPEQPDAGWTPLLDTSLDGWSGWPQGDQGVFRVEDGVLHVLDVPTNTPRRGEGYLASVETFEHYHLRFEYRWGEKRFNAAERGGGFLYHIVGPDKRWPRSLEFQIQEGDTGDLWLIGGTSADTTVASVSGTPQYREGGAPYTTRPRPYTRLVKSGTSEKAGWNQVELIVTGDEIVHIVNGRVNNRVTNPTQPDGGGRASLESGRIAFQAQNAEILYRNIKIKVLE